MNWFFDCLFGRKAEEGFNRRCAQRDADPINALSMIDAATAKIHMQIDQAKRSGRWMVAIWRVEDGKVHLEKTRCDFPDADVPLAARLFLDDGKPPVTTVVIAQK
jgi:hypothetical protein